MCNFFIYYVPHYRFIVRIRLPQWRGSGGGETGGHFTRLAEGTRRALAAQVQAARVFAGYGTVQADRSSHVPGPGREGAR
jgi:hypothetical protein